MFKSSRVKGLVAVILFAVVGSILIYRTFALTTNTVKLDGDPGNNNGTIYSCSSQVPNTVNGVTYINTHTPAFNLAANGGLASYQWFIDGISQGTVNGDGFGFACPKVTTPLPDGPHSFTAIELAPTAGTHTSPDPLNFTIDTVPPPAPSTPKLASYSDTGTIGDGITTYKQVAIQGTATPGFRVQVLGSIPPGAPTLMGGTVTDANGNWSATTPVLALGTYTVFAKVFDQANNTAVSGNFTLSITSASTLSADISGDGSVGIADLTILAANYGTSGKTFGQGDITGDGIVNIYDFSILAAQWGQGGGTTTYIQPGTVGYLGPIASLTEISAPNSGRASAGLVPKLDATGQMIGTAANGTAGWTWTNGTFLRYNGVAQTITLDHIWIRGPLFSSVSGANFKITNSVLDTRTTVDTGVWRGTTGIWTPSGQNLPAFDVQNGVGLDTYDSTYLYTTDPAFLAGAIYGPKDGFHALRIEQWGGCQGFPVPSNALIEYSWLHHMEQAGNNCHLDSVYFDGTQNTTLQYNYIDQQDGVQLPGTTTGTGITTAIFTQDHGVESSGNKLIGNYIAVGYQSGLLGNAQMNGVNNETQANLLLINNIFFNGTNYTNYTTAPWGSLDPTSHGNRHVDGSLVPVASVGSRATPQAQGFIHSPTDSVGWYLP